MKRAGIALCLLLLSGPSWAQSADPEAPPAPDPNAEEGLSLMERGAQILLRSMIDSMQPQLNQMGDDMATALTEMQPALRELARLIGDIRNYEAPEVLPNGDIIIRRKRPVPPVPPGSETEIEL